MLTEFYLLSYIYSLLEVVQRQGRSERGTLNQWLLSDEHHPNQDACWVPCACESLPKPHTSIGVLKGHFYVRRQGKLTCNHTTVVTIEAG